MKNFYEIKNETANAVDVYIYDRIGNGFFIEGTSAKKFITDLNKHKDKTVNLHINSPGGSVFEGYAIYNYLSERGNVDVHIDGLAASISSIVALAGQKISMAKNGLFMIHNPFTSVDGDRNKLQKTIDILDKIKSQMVDVYYEKTGIEKAEIVKMMDAETWLTASEAKEKGFVDEITGSMKIAANAMGYAPLTEMGFMNIPEKIKVGGTMEELLKTLGVENEAAAVLKVNALLKLKAENDTLKSEIKSLQSDLAKQEEKTIENIVQDAIKEGKLMPSQKEWATNLAKTDKKLFDEYIANSKNLLKTEDIESSDKPPNKESAYSGDSIEVK